MKTKITEQHLLNFGFIKQNRTSDQIDNDIYLKDNIYIVWYNAHNENFMQMFVNNKGINLKHVNELEYYINKNKKT